MAAPWSSLVRLVRQHRAVASAVAILALSIALFAVDISGIWGGSGSPFGSSPWWGLLTVVPGCALVALQHRRPLLALALGTALFVADFAWFGTLGMIFVLHELVYSATASLTPAGRRRMLGGLVAIGAVVIALVAIASRDLRTTVLVALLAFALLGTPYWWATAVRRAEEIAELHAERAEDAARLAGLRARDAVRRERERMARDLHDVIAGELSAVALRSEAALTRDADEARDREALGAIRETSLRSLEEMRAMILLLRSGEEPAVAADRLDRLPEIVAGTAGLEVTLEAERVNGLPAAIDQAGARIVRESLLNAAKHAAGGTAIVRVVPSDDEVRIEVLSHGGTPAGTGGAGLGLVTLRERAEALGGHLTAGPRHGGWRVLAQLPRKLRV